MKNLPANRTRTRTRKQPGRAACAPKRGGFSLLEVLLAMAILVGAIAVLGELMSIGMNSVEEARDEARAEVLAEGVMDEVLAGIIPAQAAGDTALPEELLTPDEQGDGWVYSLELETASDAGMMVLKVKVTQGTSAQFDSTRTEFTLTRWIIDPAVLTEMANAEAEAESAAEAASSSTSTGSTGTTSSSSSSAGAGSRP